MHFSWRMIHKEQVVPQHVIHSAELEQMDHEKIMQIAPPIDHLRNRVWPCVGNFFLFSL